MTKENEKTTRDNSLTGLPRTVHQGVDGLRLQTLVRLRWLAVIGQSVAVLTVYFLFDFPLPLIACLALIAMSAWLNIFLSVRWRASLRLEDRFAVLLLAYDACQLAGLLYLTGGLENPFSFLFLVPVTVSATTLPISRTVGLAMFTLALITILAASHYPLPWKRGEDFRLPVLYLAGVWSALVCGLGFASVYAYRVSSEARDMSGALAATEFVLAQEQRLSALDGLAAAAAHELGTPLATIALVAKELKHDLPNADDFAEDLDLLSSQTDRCREILSKLANRDAQREDMLTRLKLTVLLEELIEPFRTGMPEIEMDARSLVESSFEPVVTRHPGIRYGLANLLENAVDYAKSQVRVEVRWNAREVIVIIIDDGPGFSEDIIDRLGDPYVTTRKGYGSKQLANAPTKGHQGMGLGFFIAKTLLTRTGANVALANLAHPLSGATIRISWPREKIEPKDNGWAF
ncbi:MAG TPA: ActS/PrrB/RegB family redox-sensitive histidine kinase [Rhizobiales bacterium]|nr:ActS/PrrB/RegB family redox-sensitive histidine kinase [Hyphomicrobiales bacterium]